MWFKTLTGFYEQSPAQVRNNISLNGTLLKSHINGQEFHCGTLEIPSLAELRQRVHSNSLSLKQPSGTLSLREVIGNTQHLHAESANAGALFQVASQFNLLEMVSPNVTPEQGVSGYENDMTQGPACAVAAGAGTIYRNYFAPVNGQQGQSKDNQIDCLIDMGNALGNSDKHLWTMKNGYAQLTKKGLIEISNTLKSASEADIDNLRQLLRIGMQWDTEVTISETKHKVSQAYCSALPVAYSRHKAELYTEFAQLILEASYEAVFCAAIINAAHTGNKSLYLTLIGGGVFGNKPAWIIKAIARSLTLYQQADLDVAIVSYNYPNEAVQQLITEFAS